MNPVAARRILLVALLLGLLGDLVSRGPFWPTGFALCVIVSAVALLLVTGTEGEGITRERAMLAGGMILAASGLMLRSAATVQFFDTVALLACAVLLVWRMGGRGLVDFRPVDVAIGGVRTGVAMLTGFPLLAFRDSGLRGGSAEQPRRLRALVVGSLFALPPILMIAALLGQADPAFGKFLEAWTGPNFEEALGHVLATAFITWPVAGWLRAASRPAEDDLAGLADRAVPRFDFYGVAPALYGIAALLATYLGFQARALFGGAAYVEATTGLTYSEYARRGFFELVAVTAIVLGILLVADRVLDHEDGKASRRFRVTGWVVVALVAVLMGSALQRMWVYVSFFGLSDTRLYATAGMTWLAAAIGWFGWTVLRGRPARFGFGLLVASAAWVAALNLMNPEGVVVRVNLARALEGKAFDVIYHGHLSADATDALVAGAPSLGAGDCRGLLMLVHDDHAVHRERWKDWRTWSAPVARADRTLAGSRDRLLDRSCPPS
jgi:hypothetical protein